MSNPNPQVMKDPKIPMEICFVNNGIDVSRLIDKIVESSGKNLYVDVKAGSAGVMTHQSRHDFDILQFHIGGTQVVYQVDIQELREWAFSVKGSPSRGPAAGSLKSILESTIIKKVFHDVRYAAYTLKKTYDISLRNVHDLQVQELAVREPIHQNRRVLDEILTTSIMFAPQHITSRNFDVFHPNVMESVEGYIQLNLNEKAVFDEFKKQSEDVFHRGPRIEASERPMPDSIKRCYAVDIQFLPKLMDHFGAVSLHSSWKKVVDNMMTRRIHLAQRVEVEIWNRAHLEDKVL